MGLHHTIFPQNRSHVDSPTTSVTDVVGEYHILHKSEAKDGLFTHQKTLENCSTLCSLQY
jgi:hypothetical protein